MHTRHRMSPLTALFLGATAVIVAAITSGSVILLYAMHMGDRWGGDIIALAHKGVENLPDMIEALPPTIGDVLDDRRAPDYVDQLGVQVRLVSDETGAGVHPVVSVENRGGQTVTLLALRVVALDDKGVPVGEWTEYAATPITIDRDWRGPILPSATRRFSLPKRCGLDLDAKVTYEITDVRVWSATVAESEPLVRP